MNLLCPKCGKEARRTADSRYIVCSKCGPLKSEDGVAGPRARRTDPATSHAAAASMRTEAASQRDRIHAFLKEHGPHTADELDGKLDLRVTSAGRRLSELEKEGRAHRLEATKLTRSGRAAHMWAALG